MKATFVDYADGVYRLDSMNNAEGKAVLRDPTGLHTVPASEVSVIQVLTICDCCDTHEADLHHDRPDAGGVYDYCTKCNNAGCGDPAEPCELNKEPEEVHMSSADLEAEYLALMANPPTPAVTETEQTVSAPPPAAADEAQNVEAVVRALAGGFDLGQPTEEQARAEAEADERARLMDAMGPGHAQPSDDEKFWPAAQKVQTMIDQGQYVAARLGIEALAGTVMPMMYQQMLAEVDEVLKDLPEENHEEFLNHVLSSLVDFRAMGGEQALTQAQEQFQEPLDTGTFQDILADLDPRDSEAALAMLDYLLRTGRLNRVGVLDGGQGYMFIYKEPKGTTKAGYRPGGTQGDRLVDAAVDAQRASGQRPAKRGMCPQCLSAVRDTEDGTIVLDDPENPTPECSGSDSGHLML